tara:strand:- start:43 stop:429 length:387 start_codon:yes stop_codon:yes gene_type:complete
MATITPRITLISNASDTAVPGPLSVALNLDEADILTTGTIVHSGIARVTALHTDNQIFVNTYGACYIYLINRSDVTIYTGSDGLAAGRFQQLLAGEFTWQTWAGEQNIFLYHVSGAVIKDCEYWIFYI